MDIKMDLEALELEGMNRAHYSGSGQGPVAGSCFHGSEFSYSAKCWEFLSVAE
jgi:hypothetical protein